MAIGSYFVELARLIFLFRVGITHQFFVGVALSEAGGNNLLVGLFGRQILWLGVELAQFLFCFRGFLLGFSIFFLGLWEFFVWLSPFFCLSGKRGEILLSSRHQPVNFFISRRACAVFCS